MKNNKITIRNLDNREVTCSKEKKLLSCIHESGVDWLHSCGGKGKCTTCKAIILEGNKNISPLTSAEEKFTALGKLKSNERLMCQCQIFGDIIITVPKECRLPHLKYDK